MNPADSEHSSAHQQQSVGDLTVSGDENPVAVVSAAGDAAIDQSRHIVYYIHNYYYPDETSVVAVSAAISDDLPCPYRGLFHFGPKDAEFFFGRQVFVNELVQAVQTRDFVPVLGASGNGKSSVVFAGLVPQLQQSGHWQFTHFRPGAEPFHALASALVPLYTPELDATEQIRQARSLAAYLQDGSVPLGDVIAQIQQNYPNQRVLLIADQFEELYTLCSKETTRRGFLDCLLASLAVTAKVSPLVLVATMRVDFLGNALSYRPFADVLQSGDVKLGAMNQEELCAVIEQPAAKLGVTFAAGLIKRILDAVINEPGNLPLLEFALTELWSRRSGTQLTHAAYEAIGEVEGALTRYADQQYARLSAVEQEQVRRIFVQLVRPGEGTEDTRRLATKAELGEERWKLVTQLANSRLVVTSQDGAKQETVEIVHEALIRNWGELQRWMIADRDFRTWQERLRLAIQQWEDMRRSEEALLRGKFLSDAKYWYTHRYDELSFRDRQFIQLSLTVQEREGKKRRRRRQLLLSTLIAGVIIVLLFLQTGWLIWQNSALGKVRSISTEANALFVSEKRLDSLVESLRAWGKLRKLTWVDTDTRSQVEDTLRQSVYGAIEQNRLSGHADKVYSVVFSPDGQMIASASEDQTVKLWRPDGTLLNTLKGHQGGVRCVAFSPDSQTIASASADGTVMLWQRNGSLKTILKGHARSARGVAFSPDGQMIATTSEDQTVKLWRPDGTLLNTLRGHTDEVYGVAFSPDSQTIASGSKDRTIRLWQRDGKSPVILRGHTNSVHGVAFSPDGQVIASASMDHTIKLWNQDGSLLNTFDDRNHNALYGIAFSPDSKIIASTSWDKAVRLWNRDSTLLHRFQGHNSRIWGVAFSPDGQIIASASDDKTIRLWKWEKALISNLLHSEAVYDVAFSPDGQLIASADDKTVGLRSPNGTLQSVIKGHSASVTKVAFSADSQLIASASDDQTARLWRRDGTLLSILKGHRSKVKGVGFDSSGQLIATASDDRTIKLWKPNGTLLRTLEGHLGNVTGVVFSPDGKILASSSDDRTVRIWKRDGTSLTILKDDAEVWNIAFSPDGQTIATASDDKTVKLWSTNGTLLTTLKGHSGTVWGVAFSLDGQTIATASDDKTVKLWSTNGALLTTLKGHSGTVWGVAFSPDGQTIATASDDKSIIIWNLDYINSASKLVDFACDWTSNYLRTNVELKEEDRHLCDGAKAIRQQ